MIKIEGVDPFALLDAFVDALAAHGVECLVFAHDIETGALVHRVTAPVDSTLATCDASIGALFEQLFGRPYRNENYVEHAQPQATRGEN